MYEIKRLNQLVLDWVISIVVLEASVGVNNQV